ncbi:pentapeptide repeat-containing protein [Streptosporangium sp. NPDC000396]|uniref:pentapeptide repeat-containing protein n=1 Tax=Streptosporangium sp. NPDC000396 TaxID=3366185 RepID=UPI00369E3B8C
MICAYLRMPFTPPSEQDRHTRIRAAQRAARAGASRPDAGRGRDPHEEQEVRLTAQRILADHLRYQPPARRWWQPRDADLNARHWPGIQLDLTGATLINLNLNGCRVRDAMFREATFTDYTKFDGATFTSHAAFHGVTFTCIANERSCHLTIMRCGFWATRNPRIIASQGRIRPKFLQDYRDPVTIGIQ